MMKKLFLTVFCLGLIIPAFAELSEQERIIRQTVLYETGSNYIERAYFAGNKILRWNKSEFPIKVYVENSLNVPNYYSYAFVKAAAVWQSEMKDVISIVFVTDEDEANICFKVIDPKKFIRKPGAGETEVLAYTETSHKGNKLLKANIYFYERNSSGKFYKPYEILNIAVHEFGHALGIAGHSDDETSLMYALYSPRNQKQAGFLNRQDKNTVKLLYKITPDITNGDKSKEKDTYKAEILVGSFDERVDTSIKNASGELKIKPGDCLSRLQLAALYEQKGDFDKMYQYIKEAEPLAKTKDELYGVHIGYAVYYYGKKDRQKAKIHIDKALSMKDDKGAREFKSDIERLK